MFKLLTVVVAVVLVACGGDGAELEGETSAQGATPSATLVRMPTEQDVPAYDDEPQADAGAAQAPADPTADAGAELQAQEPAQPDAGASAPALPFYDNRPISVTGVVGRGQVHTNVTILVGAAPGGADLCTFDDMLTKQVHQGSGVIAGWPGYRCSSFDGQYELNVLLDGGSALIVSGSVRTPLGKSEDLTQPVSVQFIDAL